MGRTLEGWATKSPAMAMAKTASTSHTSKSTKIRNITRARLPSRSPAMSATERPPSRTLNTSAPKSWAAPMKMLPTTTQTRAGSQPQ